jgi:hypothetical protein
MVDQDQLDEFLGALEALGGSSGNDKLRQMLGWEEASYGSVKSALFGKGAIVLGRGRGGSVSIAGASTPPRSRSAKQLLHRRPGPPEP